MLSLVTFIATVAYFDADDIAIHRKSMERVVLYPANVFNNVVNWKDMRLSCSSTVGWHLLVDVLIITGLYNARVDGWA